MKNKLERENLVLRYIVMDVFLRVYSISFKSRDVLDLLTVYSQNTSIFVNFISGVYKRRSSNPNGVLYL